MSHVTGFATLFGVDVVNGQIEAAIGILSVPVFFLFGAFLAGLMIDRPIYLGKKPHFDWVMGLSALCLFIVAAAGALPLFGNFGDELSLRRSYLLLALLCLASGLQNAAITSSSGRSVRTTHLTGLTTDLGIGLSRALTVRSEKDRFSKEMWTNYLRAGSIAAFVVGSAIGAGVFLRFGYSGFILSGLVATYAAWHGRKAKITAHELLDP